MHAFSISITYTTVCPPVRGDNPQVVAIALSPGQADKPCYIFILSSSVSNLCSVKYIVLKFGILARVILRTGNANSLEMLSYQYMCKLYHNRLMNEAARAMTNSKNSNFDLDLRPTRLKCELVKDIVRLNNYMALF